MNQPAFLLLKTNDLYAPEKRGAQQMLLGGGKILAMGPDLSAEAAALGARTLSHDGKIVPGLIDQHIHFIGGGDGDGPLARIPEQSFAAIASAGITTAAGLLGSETEAKNLNQLLRKANELQRGGLTTFIYTGGMPLPPPCLTGSVRSDVVLIDKVIGAKSAIAERIYPNLDFAPLASLAGELLQARSATGKAAVLHLHVGRLKEGLDRVFRLIDAIDFPIGMIAPTHINRSPDVAPLFQHGLRFAKSGGTIDFTCCLGPLDNLPAGLDVVEAVRRSLDAGAPIERITLSSDAGVAVPADDGAPRAVPPAILFRDVRRLVREGGLNWEQALLPATRNVARVLGLADRKGQIAAGADADLVFLDHDDRIAAVMAGGRIIHRTPNFPEYGSAQAESCGSIDETLNQ